MLLNSPELWRNGLPYPKEEDNKYSRGAVLVMGGGVSCAGAARMAAYAAARSGAGAVSICCDGKSMPIYAASLTSIMTKHTEQAQDFLLYLNDKKYNTTIIGCGCGVDERTKEFVLIALSERSKISNVIIDADAITVFENDSATLFSAIKAAAGSKNIILTPHEGEFSRLFRDSIIDLSADRKRRAVQAAELSGANILLKGSKTLIVSAGTSSSEKGKENAAAAEKIVVNSNAPPLLATAGAGDVLAGIIAGLTSQGMRIYDAACAASWIHADAANRLGIGMIAEDIPDILPVVLGELYI